MPAATSLTLLVASGGGHLVELVALADRLNLQPDSCLWATSRSAQAERLLRGYSLRWVRDVPPKRIGAALSVLPRAFEILRHDPVREVISTGAAVAVPFALAARALNIPFHYVESLARTAGPSLSGRLVSLLGAAQTWTQSRRWASRSWPYAGSILGSYSTTPASQTGPLKIVVTFGTQAGFIFKRGVQAIERVTSSLVPRPEVTWQLGSTARYFPRLGAHELVDVDRLSGLMRQAHVVIAHGGVGSALMALANGHAPILLPRRRRHGEHTDDHQAAFAEELSARGLALCVDPDRLQVAHIHSAAQRRVVSIAQDEPMPIRDRVVPWATRAGEALFTRDGDERPML